MKISQLKTIDYRAKEWRDKTYGNTYFSSQVTLNYGLPNETSFSIPFQYGDTRHGEDIVGRKILALFPRCKEAKKRPCLWRFCEARKIILRKSSEQTLKRYAKEWGE